MSINGTIEEESQLWISVALKVIKILTFYKKASV